MSKLMKLPATLELIDEMFEAKKYYLLKVAEKYKCNIDIIKESFIKKVITDKYIIKVGSCNLGLGFLIESTEIFPTIENAIYHSLDYAMMYYTNVRDEPDYICIYK